LAVSRRRGRALGSLVAPVSSASTDRPDTIAAIERLRRHRFTSQQIARDLAVSLATVSRALSRLNRFAARELAELFRRYERERLAN
jgi:Mn-dependent DtxR family transcriptional regulator